MESEDEGEVGGARVRMKMRTRHQDGGVNHYHLV